MPGTVKSAAASAELNDAERAEMLREIAGGLSADARNTESVEKPPQRCPLRFVNRLEQVRRRDVGDAFDLDQVALRQGEQIGHGTHKPLGNERVDGLSAKAADIQRLARAKVLDRALELRRTGQAVRASIKRPFVNNCRVTDGAARRHDEGAMAARTWHEHALDDVRNDVAGPNDAHDVADTEILACDLIPVVQRGSRHGNAADLHRSQYAPPA